MMATEWSPAASAAARAASSGTDTGLGMWCVDVQAPPNSAAALTRQASGRVMCMASARGVPPANAPEHRTSAPIGAESSPRERLKANPEEPGRTRKKPGNDDLAKRGATAPRVGHLSYGPASRSRVGF